MLKVFANATAKIILQSLNCQTKALYTLNLPCYMSIISQFKKKKELSKVEEGPAQALPCLTHRATANRRAKDSRTMRPDISELIYAQKC